MPGPEQAVLIREVIVLRVTPNRPSTPSSCSRRSRSKWCADQWRRVIFVQTNREDVGHRYKEILLPIPFGSRRSPSRVEGLPHVLHWLVSATHRVRRSAQADGLNHFPLNGEDQVAADVSRPSSRTWLRNSLKCRSRRPFCGSVRARKVALEWPHDQDTGSFRSRGRGSRAEG